MNRFERTRDRGPVGRWLVLLGGAALFVVGLILMPLPGPGIVIALFGCALMAGQSARVAQALDEAEVRARGLLKR